jgi:AcrR family transcriptional regulator
VIGLVNGKQTVAETAGRGPRADALRNRERLLASASRLFVERGPDVPFTEIAKDAGVGVGTVYRHFPTRDLLIEAAYRSELDAVCDSAADLVRELPAEGALRAWMDRFLDYMFTKIGMSAAIGAVISAGGNPYAHSRDRLNTALGLLIDAATDAGRTRSGINVDDVLMTLSGIAMATGGPDRRAQAGRMLDLLFDGMRDDS